MEAAPGVAAICNSSRVPGNCIAATESPLAVMGREMLSPEGPHGLSAPSQCQPALHLHLTRAKHFKIHVSGFEIFFYFFLFTLYLRYCYKELVSTMKLDIR